MGWESVGTLQGQANYSNGFYFASGKLDISFSVNTINSYNISLNFPCIISKDNNYCYGETSTFFPSPNSRPTSILISAGAMEFSVNGFQLVSGRLNTNSTIGTSIDLTRPTYFSLSFYYFISEGNKKTLVNRILRESDLKRPTASSRNVVNSSNLQSGSMQPASTDVSQIWFSACIVLPIDTDSIVGCI